MWQGQPGPVAEPQAGELCINAKPRIDVQALLAAKAGGQELPEGAEGCAYLGVIIQVPDQNPASG